MRRTLLRALAIAGVLGAALVAYAVGNGDVVATPAVTVITITSPTGTGNGTATLENTTGTTTYNVAVSSDPSCDPQLTFAVVGGNPVAIGPGTSRSVQLGCPARGVHAMRRCLYHAKNSATGTALADFTSVCLYGTSATLVPQPSSLDFGSVTVGDSATLQLDVRNDGAQPITRVYLQTTDLGGNFQLSTPCNPDAPYCDATVSAIAPGATLPVQIRCTPQAAGTHTARLHLGTSTFQLLAQPVTLTCNGSATTSPVLGVNPTAIDLPFPFEVTSGSASTVIHLTNTGGSTLLITDIRTVDVDRDAATDWTYTASGECTGVITTPCSLEAGEQVDINLTFDPSAIGRRRATLLISYRDMIDRTTEIPLGGAGVGATIELAHGRPPILFGMVPVGRTSAVDVELVNRGDRDITAQLSVSALTTPPYSLSASTTALSPNMPKPVTLTCAPTSAGPVMTTFTAQAMDAFSGSPLSLLATCEGSTLELYANPTAINLGEIRTNGSPVTRTVQLLATAAPLTLTGQPLQESPNAAVSLGVLSQMTTPASFDVRITPQTEGDIVTTIVISEAGGSTLRIPVTARVVTADYEVAPKLDLGTFCVKQSTTSGNASLASTDSATIEVAQPTLGGSSPFSLVFTSPTQYPTTLPAGKTATVAVTPERQQAATQLLDTLAWHTDVEGKPSAVTTLSARFIDEGGAIAPPVLDFGKVPVHLYFEDGQRVVIQNCNPTPLVLDPPMIKTPFSIDSPTFPGMLNPNETVTFSVGFHPTRIGRIVDTLRITSPQLPGAPLEVMLIGEGVTTERPPVDAGTDGSGKNGTSFYACSCKTSRPGGLVPLLIALACVLAPRRRARLPR
jgi:hypothetical protein